MQTDVEDCNVRLELGSDADRRRLVVRSTPSIASAVECLHQHVRSVFVAVDEKDADVPGFGCGGLRTLSKLDCWADCWPSS